MNAVTRSLAAVPFIQEILRRADILLAIGVCMIAGLLIVPLPPGVLDVLLSLSISGSLLLLLTALFARRALDISTFPSLLLITTLFRLALNVSTTRGILTNGDAGDVVKAFGQFVVQGDFVVGTVIFLVITIVQFLVIAKGAERVAEVAARFTLDAMPGKQMSIDAALRNGSIDADEAEARRDELGRESQLFGNMDGAMKFVKGDAIAGLIVTALNLVAGFIIGIARNDMSFAEALKVYSILTVGDGLVSQVAALFVTLSAAVLVTRVDSKDKKDNLGMSMRGELLGNRVVLLIGGGLCTALALIPGLPAIPFLMIGALLWAIAAGEALFGRIEPEPSPAEVLEDEIEQKLREAEKQQAVTDRLAPAVVPAAIELGRDLSTALGFGPDGSSEYSKFVDVLLPQLREALYLETGVHVPTVQVRPHAPNVPPTAFRVLVKEVPAVQDRLPVGRLFAMAAPRQLRRLGVVAEEGQHPVTREPISLISVGQRRVAEASAINVWDLEGVLALHIGAALRRRIKHFIGIHEVGELIDKLEKAYPMLVRETVPKLVSLASLVDILRRLVDENVNIRDLKTVLEACAEHATYSDDTLFLTEKARAALADQIAHQYAGQTQRLHVIMLDPVIEDTIADGIVRDQAGSMLCLEPELRETIVSSLLVALEPMLHAGHRPIILTAATIRRFVRVLLEAELPSIAALSFDELPSDLIVQPMGRATIQ